MQTQNSLDVVQLSQLFFELLVFVHKVFHLVHQFLELLVLRLQLLLELALDDRVVVLYRLQLLLCLQFLVLELLSQLRQLLAHAILLCLLVAELFRARLIFPVLFRELLFQLGDLLAQFRSVLLCLELKLLDI